MKVTIPKTTMEFELPDGTTRAVDLFDAVDALTIISEKAKAEPEMNQVEAFRDWLAGTCGGPGLGLAVSDVIRDAVQIEYLKQKKTRNDSLSSLLTTPASTPPA